MNMKAITLFTILVVSLPAGAGTPPEVGSSSYPISGSPARELIRLTTEACTNFGRDELVGYLFIRKGSVTIGTTVMANGVAQAAHDYVFADDGKAWTLSSKSGNRPCKAGLPPADFIELLRAVTSEPDILSIRIDSAGQATVMTGAVADALSGSGTSLTYVKKDGVWIRTRTSHWVS